MEDEIKIGDTVELDFYGKTIRGTVNELGAWTGKPIKMRRHDINRNHAILNPDALRKVEA
jgi:hypothetical protein